MKSSDSQHVPIADHLSRKSQSALQNYLDVFVSNHSIIALLYYEIANLVAASLPGAFGFLL